MPIAVKKSDLTRNFLWCLLVAQSAAYAKRTGFVHTPLPPYWRERCHERLKWTRVTVEPLSRSLRSPQPQAHPARVATELRAQVQNMPTEEIAATAGLTIPKLCMAVIAISALVKFLLSEPGTGKGESELDGDNTAAVVARMQHTASDKQKQAAASQNVLECGKCGFVLFQAAGRHNMLSVLENGCPSCGAAKSGFVDLIRGGRPFATADNDDDNLATTPTADHDTDIDRGANDAPPVTDDEMRTHVSARIAELNTMLANEELDGDDTAELVEKIAKNERELAAIPPSTSLPVVSPDNDNAIVIDAEAAAAPGET